MANPVIDIAAVVQRFLSSDRNTTGKPRSNQVGDLTTVGIYPGLQQSAAEDGFYYFVNEGTRNTGVSMTIATGTAYAATQAMLVVDNAAPPSGPDIVLDYFLIKQDAVDTAGTTGFLYAAMDDVMRYSSGGTKMAGFNSAGAPPPVGNFYTGAITAAAAGSNVRDLWGFNYINGVGVANLAICLKFGAADPGVGAAQTVPATTAGYFTFYLPPVVVHPGKSFVLNEFKTARTAAGTGEFFLGAIVR